MKKDRISIALTTFNGSKYIAALLDSLRYQIKKPDEVIIADDCSTDNTVEIVKNYIKKYKLSSWSVYVNNHNLGWQKNFTQVISKTTGKYIFLADQDDIWRRDKILKFFQCFKRTNAMMVVSDFEVIGNGKSRKTTVMPTLNYEIKNNYKRIKMGNNYGTVMRPGCVMAVDSLIKPIYLKLWFKSTPHDALLWNIANINNSIFYLDFPSIKFRRTNNNASGTIAHSIEFKINDIIREIVVDRWYLNSTFMNPSIVKKVNENLIWNKLRYQLIVNHKFNYWLRLFRYKKFYNSFKQYVGDLYYYLISEKNRS